MEERTQKLINGVWRTEKEIKTLCKIDRKDESREKRVTRKLKLKEKKQRTHKNRGRKCKSDKSTRLEIMRREKFM